MPPKILVISGPTASGKSALAVAVAAFVVARLRHSPGRTLEIGAVATFVILAVLAALWELTARWQDNDLLLPTFTATARAFVDGIATGELLEE